MPQAILQPTQFILPIIGTITYYRSRSSNRFSLALMHQSIALQAVTIYRPETQTNKLKLIFNKSLTFVWLLSLKWEKWQNWDKNCKSVAVNSDVIRALRYWHSNPPPPTPGTWRGIKHWPGVKIPLIFPLPGPRRLLKAPYSRALVVLG